ncbi:NHL repeat-containing protein [Ekhidna sp.]
MRYLLLIFAATFLVVSCQIEDDNAPAPEETFIKYFGELTSYEASDIEIIFEGETPIGLAIFGTKVNDLGDKDFYVLRTDLDGNLIDSTSVGFVNQTLRDFTGDGNPDSFRGEETSAQIQPIPGGGFIIIGTSGITETVLGISDFQLLSLGFLADDLSIIGDSLLVLSSEVDNVDLDLVGNDVLILSDGAILMAGAREVDRGGGITDFDNYYIKFNLNNDEVLFENTQGVAGEDDVLVRAFEKDNGNIVLIGYSNSPSLLGENNNNNGSNVYFLEVSSTGTPINFASYGFENTDNNVVYNEQVNNAISTASGYTIVGTSVTSEDESFSFVMNLSNDGVFLSGTNHNNSIYNTTNNNGEVSVVQTQGFGVTQALGNDIVLLGQYESLIAEGQSRGVEGMFVRFDQAAQPIEGAESFFGLADGNDRIVDAVTLPDGKIVAVANVDFGGGVQLISVIKMNPDGSLD